MTAGICSVDGCGKPVAAKGLCTTHYARQRRNGTTETVYRNTTPRTCKIEGCGRRAKSMDMCNMHYARYLSGSDQLHVPGPIVGGTLMERVARHVQADGEHQVWTGAVTGTREMPVLRTDNTMYSVRRIMWAQVHGEADPNHWVVATCEVPRCVAPAHLALSEPHRHALAPTTSMPAR